MNTEGKPGNWQRRYLELRAQYDEDPTPFEPKCDAQATVKLLFPELVSLP